MHALVGESPNAWTVAGATMAAGSPSKWCAWTRELILGDRNDNCVRPALLATPPFLLPSPRGLNTRGGKPAHSLEQAFGMVLAIVLIVLAILLGLGGLFTALKWLLVVAAVLLVAGVVVGFIRRGRTRSLP